VRLRRIIGLAIILVGMALMLSIRASVAPLELFKWAGALGMTAREGAAVSGLTMTVVGLAVARRR